MINLPPMKFGDPATRAIIDELRNKIRKAKKLSRTDTLQWPTLCTFCGREIAGNEEHRASNTQQPLRSHCPCYNDVLGLAKGCGIKV